MATLIHPATCDTCKHLPICKYKDLIFQHFCDCAECANKEYDIKIGDITIHFYCDNYKKKKTVIKNICENCTHNKKVLAEFKGKNSNSLHRGDVKTYCEQTRQVNPCFQGCVYFEAGGEEK